MKTKIFKTLFLIGLVITALPLLHAEQPKTVLATFAGGCFWCMEPPFEKLDGVRSVTSGFSGGDQRNPTYKQVSAGVTKHAEVVQVEFDPSVISYKELLKVYWRNTDPTVQDRQFCDRGHQYRPAIFYHTEEQKQEALQSKMEIEKLGQLDKPILTEITAFKFFQPAEDYHQDYYKKNPANYKRYRLGCGRDKRLRELWGK